MASRSGPDERAGPAALGDPVAARSEAERGPRVRIWTTDEGSGLSRLRPVIRLEDDAYVIVVNVGLDGYANVLFPESPEDDGFMRGGRTYRLESFFPGFANHFYRTQYGRLHNATAAYDDIYDRHAGYVFVIATWRPMHFELTEATGLWSDYRLAAHERRLEPYDVMHGYAARLVAGGQGYTARFARYAAFGDRFARAPSLSYCSLYGPGLGYLPWSLLHAGFTLVPTYGFGYGGGGQCGYGYTFVLATRPIVRRPTFTRPVRPPAAGDTATKPPGTRPRRPTRDKDDDERERKSGRRPRRAEAEAETIVDVTRDTRELARRRERDDERGRSAARGESGYRPSSGYERTGRGRAPERVSWAEEESGARRETSRSSPRSSEPRQSEPRSEPRQSEPRTHEPRREAPQREAPQRYERPASRPEPRSEPRPQPTPRSEPASRPEPRGERPTKPADPA